MVRYASRVGAAAFVLGLSLGGPYSMAVATADTSDSASASAAPGDSQTGSTPATRAARGGNPAPRGGAEQPAIASIPARPASAVRAGAEIAPDPAAEAIHPRRGSRTTRVAPDVVRAATAPGTAGVGVPGPVEPEQHATAHPAPSAAPIPVPRVPETGESTTGAAIEVATAALPDPPAALAAPDPTPGALAILSAPAGSAAASFADILNGLFSPIGSLFEGAALLWRRTFFNEGPTLDPVQLTGQVDGTITGTLGAVDPEDDPLVYKITTGPRYGFASVNADGSYSYTPGPGFTGSDSFVAAATDTGFHINLLDLFRPASTSSSVAVSRGVPAPVLRFQFVYGAGAGLWSSGARGALESAAAQLSSYIVVSSAVKITYAVTGNYSPLSSTLASAGSDFISNGSGFMQTVVQSKVLSGADANGSSADGEIAWNFGPSWAFGNTVGGNQYDFQSIALHELLHTFGFLSYVDQAGANTDRMWTVFDSFLVNSAGTPVITGDFSWNSAYNPNLTGGNGGLYFGGPNAVAAFNGLVPLYTPNPWASGSSLSHLNDNRFTGSNEKLMNAVSSQGPGIRVLSAVELGILEDLGYDVTPGGSVLMFVGFFVSRRPRRRD